MWDVRVLLLDGVRGMGIVLARARFLSLSFSRSRALALSLSRVILGDVIVVCDVVRLLVEKWWRYEMLVVEYVEPCC